jgi:hypothetical protein
VADQVAQFDELPRLEMGSKVRPGFVVHEALTVQLIDGAEEGDL